VPSATAPGFLLDRFGRPAVYGGQGNLYRRTREDDDLRPKPPSHFADFLALLSPHRYRELVTECRFLRTRGLVSAILENRADYVSASHYRPRFTGTDEAFGADLIAALEDSLALCNLRGPRFDWRTTWRLSSISRATDGSFFVLLTSWGDTDQPALQIFEGHRIGQRDSTDGTVKSGSAFTINTEGRRIQTPYVGLSINQGIIYNGFGQEIAYRVLGAAEDGSEDQDISARDMIHVARPRSHSEGRPVPDLAPAALDFLALQEAQTAALDNQIHDAKLTAVETNATGAPDPNLQLTGMGGKPDGTPTQLVDRGTYRYFKSGQGNIEVPNITRPSVQWMAFDQRVASRSAAALGWRIEMLDPEKLGSGAANRAFQDQINTRIQDEFQIDRPAAIRVLRYFAAKLIKSGVLANHTEAASLDIAPPPYFEVDRASAKYDLDDVAAGRSAMTILRARDGHTDREVYEMRAAAYKTAEAVSAETGVDIEILRGDEGMTVQRTGAPEAPHPEQGEAASTGSPEAKAKSLVFHRDPAGNLLAAELG
jgi:hypothetical protein